MTCSGAREFDFLSRLSCSLFRENTNWASTMRIKLTQGTYLRTCGNESLLFNPCTEAACVARNAQLLLAKLSCSYRGLDDIVDETAQSYGIDREVAKSDWQEFSSRLSRLGLIEVDDAFLPSDVQIEESTTGNYSADGDDADIATEFFKRNDILSELHMDLSSACTERCVHCYLPDYPNRFLNLQIVEKVLREFRAAQGVTVYLTGGECMLHPDFDRICRLCKELSLNVIVLTNLTCCDTERVQLLKEIEPQFVSVSIYSMNPIVHDRITRVAGSWRRTMDAFLVCEKANINLRIATPLLKENQWSFAELDRFAREHHAKLAPNFTIYAKSNGDKSNLRHICTSEELERVLNECKEVFGRNLFCGAEDSWEDKVCRIGTLRLCINSSGDYYPCDGMHGYRLGNARKHTLKEIWSGEELSRLRGLKVGDFTRCRTCQERKFCLVCPAFNFNATGNLLTPHKTKCETASVVHRVYGERS